MSQSRDAPGRESSRTITTETSTQDIGLIVAVGVLDTRWAGRRITTPDDTLLELLDGTTAAPPARPPPRDRHAGGRLRHRKRRTGIGSRP